jgi:hypothetical protein
MQLLFKNWEPKEDKPTKPKEHKPSKAPKLTKPIIKKLSEQTSMLEEMYV